MIAKFAFSTGPGGEVEENARDVAVDLPLGMVGDPSAVPACPRSDFNLESSCPANSQVGVAEAVLSGFGTLEVPVYNIEPGDDALAEIGFTLFVLQARFRVVLRSDDYGTRLETNGFVQDIPLLASRIELWGVPADHLPGSELPRRPFLTNPTSCEPAAGPAVRVRTWQRPDRWLVTELPPLPLIGCESLPFSPSLEVTPASPAADSPTGLRIALVLPQNEDPDGIATAHVKSAEVTLPPGFSLAPGVASGLAACTDADLGAGEAGAAACPPAAKIGSVELRSPAVGTPLRGPVYFGTPTAAEQFRVFIVAAVPGGQVKVRALLRADPASGRLTALLSGLPQLPVSRLELSFNDGPRAAIASPPACSDGTATARVVPFGGAVASAAAAVAISGGPGGTPCRRGPGFAPTFVAGSSPALAGKSSAFTMTVRREDGEAELGRVRAKLPPGLVARLAGVQRCADAAAAASACPPGSRLGSTLIEAGAGPAPLAVSGDVYLTGPYGGAPFGLALSLPVRVGPFDLGTTTIRTALLNDPESGRLTVTTDPLPRLVAGIPLRLRTVTIAIDRPGFIQNPTSCAPSQVEAVLESAGGATAWPAAPFQVRRCNRLRFAPRVGAKLLQARTTRPGLELRVRPRRGDANLRSVVVKLPELVRLDADAVAAGCSRQQFRASACPAASRIGSASATTPLLAEPLRGPVRLVKAGDVGPPQLWTSLRGQGLALTTRSSTSLTVGGQIVNTVAGLPDLPLTLTDHAAARRRPLVLHHRAAALPRRRRRLDAGRSDPARAERRRALAPAPGRGRPHLRGAGRVGMSAPGCGAEPSCPRL